LVPIIDLLLHHVLGMTVALLDLAFELLALAVIAARSSSVDQECFMNWDRIEGDWKQFVGKVKEKWGKLKVGRRFVTWRNRDRRKLCPA
jgi:hypothetical protein